MARAYTICLALKWPRSTEQLESCSFLRLSPPARPVSPARPSGRAYGRAHANNEMLGIHDGFKLFGVLASAVAQNTQAATSGSVARRAVRGPRR
jgi:hypothetical protein